GTSMVRLSPATRTAPVGIPNAPWSGLSIVAASPPFASVMWKTIRSEPPGTVSVPSQSPPTGGAARPGTWACVGPGAANAATTVARNVMAREAAGRRSRRGAPHRRGAPRRAVSPGSWVARITTDTRPPSDDPEDQPRGGDRRAGDAVPLEP